MSKSSRNQPVAFPSDAPVIDAESTVDASEAPETPESVPETLTEAPEAVSEAPSGVTLRDLQDVYAALPAQPDTIFIPQGSEPMSSQHELAQHIAELLAEEGAEMATTPEVEEESDVDIAAELNALATSGAILLPDGSMKISVIVSQEQIEILKSWAEGAGESFESYLQTTVELGLNAVINGGSVAG